MNKSVDSVDVVILAGGLGTRLRSEINNRPKCLASINGKVFLDILIDFYVEQGFKRFIICVGYKKDQVKAHLNNRDDCNIIFSEEITPLGTGGALKLAQSKIKSKLYIVHNGDTFVDLVLFDYIKWFLENDFQFSIVTIKNIMSEQFGTVTVSRDDRIMAFEEKLQSSKSTYINGGVYLIRNGFIDFKSYKEAFSLEKDLIPSLLIKKVYAYFCSGRFIDIGTKESFMNAKLFFK